MRLLEFAAARALRGLRSHIQKNYLLAAVIVRKDGAIVVSTNAVTQNPNPSAHAEARALKKADFGAELYVARVIRDGTWVMAKPCKTCQALIRAKGIRKVYYTISPDNYGVWDVQSSKHPEE